MKKIFVILLLYALSVPMFAEDLSEDEPETSPHHFEVGLGYNHVKNYDSEKFTFPSIGAFFEYRFRHNSKFDVAAQVNYKFGKGKDNILDDEGIRRIVSYNQVCTKLLFDYNFCREESLVSPYVGLGLGGGCVYVNRPERNKTFNFFLSITPRAGVQISRFRITCEYDLLTNRIWRSRASYSYRKSSSNYVLFATILAVNVGYTF